MVDAFSAADAIGDSSIMAAGGICCVVFFIFECGL
jgi:hypothetical protein